MATITSNASGLWSAGATWVGGVAPVNGDKVYIANTHVVTVEGACEGGDDTLTAVNVQAGGTLKFSRTANSSLTLNGELLILTGGTLDMGTEADPIPAGVLAEVIVNRSASLADGKYGITTQGSSYIKICGASKQTNSRLVADVAAGATSARIENAIGWAVGDSVCLGTTGTSSQVDIVTIATITNVSGTVYDITWVGGVTSAHAAKGIAGNFTNTVLIRPYNNAYRSYFTIIFGQAQPSNSIILKYVTFRNLNTNAASSYNEYGSLSLIGQNNDMTNADAIPVLSNLVFWQDTNLPATGQFVGSAFKNRVTMTDSAFFSGTGGNVLCYSGYVMDLVRCYMYRGANGATYAYSEGSRNTRWYDCYFTGCGTYCEAITGGINPEHYRCYYFGNNIPLSTIVANSVYFENCYFGAGGETPVGATNAASYIVGASFGALGTSTFIDCSFDVTKLMVSSTAGTFYSADPSLKVIVANKNLDPSLQEIYTPAGNFVRDNSVFKTGVACLRCDPKRANTAVSLKFQIFAPTGKPVQVSGYLRKDASYGSSTLPKVTLSGLGITESTYTMTDVNDTWEQFIVSGTQNSGTDGILTLTFTCQSGAGSAWIDGISAPPAAAVNTGDFGFWAEGQPAKLIASNYTSALDIWNTLKENVTLTGSMGKEVKNIKGDTGALL